MIQKKIFNSIFSQVIYILVSAVVGLALVPITIDMLGTMQYGVFELILSLILIDVFLEFGLGSTLVKYIPEYKVDIERLKVFCWSYYYIKLVLSILGFLVILFIGYHFNIFFNLDEVQDIESIKIAVYLFGAGLIINGLVSFLDNFLRGFVYFGIANGIKTVSVLFFFFVYYVYYIQYDILEYNIIHIVFIWFILRPIFSLVLHIVVLRYLDLSYLLKPVKFDYLIIQNTLRYMFGMTYIVMIAQFLNRAPKLILGMLTNPIYVAYWGIMEKIKEPLLQLNSSLLRPLIPILSDQTNITHVSEDKVFQASRLQYFLMSFLGIMVMVHIDLLIIVWLGEEFSSVSTIVKIMMISFLFPSAGVFLMMYYAEGKTKINRIFTTLHTIISITLAIFVILATNDLILFTVSFSVVAIFISYLSINTYLTYFKLNKVEFLKKSVLIPLQILIVYYAIISYIQTLLSIDLMGLLISICISFILYAGLFFVFMKREDKVIILEMIKWKKNI